MQDVVVVMVELVMLDGCSSLPCLQVDSELRA